MQQCEFIFNRWLIALKYSSVVSINKDALLVGIGALRAEILILPTSKPGLWPFGLKQILQAQRMNQ